MIACAREVQLDGRLVGLRRSSGSCLFGGIALRRSLVCFDLPADLEQRHVAAHRHALGEHAEVLAQQLEGPNLVPELELDGLLDAPGLVRRWRK